MYITNDDREIEFVHDPDLVGFVQKYMSSVWKRTLGQWADAVVEDALDAVAVYLQQAGKSMAVDADGRITYEPKEPA
ncbi:hypothetical protein ACFY05_32800 [Microtetraspora fusca]|uniref:Uncharacterized protein n=1 Tax=Microtetraspora fusca TaxID=1997 RepID=A0ABW6VGB0_MICFU